MDELYGNAWGDSSDIAGDIHSPPSSWISPKRATHDEEADLAAPSWSTGTGIQWDEPSEEAHGFKWSTNDTDLAWGADPTYNIPIRTSSETEVVERPAAEPIHTEDHDEEAEMVREPYVPEDKPSSLSPPAIDHHSPSALELDASLNPLPTSPPFSRTPTPDGFGTFETGYEIADEAVAGTLSPGIEEEDWGSPWVGDARADDEDQPKPVDEWEAARKQKEQLDRMIPPEVLANMLAQCTEFFQNPHEDPQPTKTDDTVNTWMNQWRNGLDSIEGLEALVRNIVPELTLQPSVQFSKTAIAKGMANTVRLTKNLPLAQNSPLSHYFATKGSTAWETAIKERKDVMEEDVVPRGWRIQDRPSVMDTQDTSKAAKQGGFFSFWGRRHSKVPSVTTDTYSQATVPQARPPSVPPANTGAASTRVSTETIPPPSSSKNDQDTSNAESEVAKPAEVTAAPSYADAPDLVTDSADASSPTQTPPSAVSRFLGRFSRTRSSLGPSSQRSSLALSSDDLDVLSDIVPSVHDGIDDDGDVPAQSLHNVLKAEPLPPMLPPPPAAPAIQPPLPNVNVSAPLANSTNRTGSEPVATVPSSSNDFDDFFGAFETVPNASVPVASAPAQDAFAMFTSASVEVAKVRNSAISSVAALSFAPSAASTHVSLADPLQPGPQPVSQQSPVYALLPAPQPGSRTVAARSTTSSNRILQPVHPLSLDMPPPVSVAPITPPLSASEIPLAQLYPNAVGKNNTSSSNLNTARIPSPFVLETAPRTHNTTPTAADQPAKPQIATPLLPPPPSFAGLSISANPVVQTQNLFDDDDFADFQSPAETAPQPFVFTLPPPPASQETPKPAFSPLHASPKTVPAPSRSSTLPPPVSADPFSDEFSSFMTPSSSSNLHPQYSQSSGLTSSIATSSDKFLFESPSLHSDFDDFVSTPSTSALHTPSPPRPIAKVTKPPFSINPPPASGVSRMSNETKTRQRQHTLSLMELAAARPGRWPAPPSPLPQAIAFPVPGTKPVDLMGEDDSFDTFSESPTALQGNQSTLLPPSASKESPAIANTASFLRSDTPPKAFSLAPTVTTKKEGNKGSGGLSAQDLSFFEGL